MPRISPADRLRDRKFIHWMKTEARIVQLVCLINGHIFPDPFSSDMSHEVLPAGHGRKRSTIQLNGACQREVDGEHCGTVIRKLLGPGGIISRSKPVYDYELWYRVPPELLADGWLSREQRGIVRTYLYVELPGQRAIEHGRRLQKARQAEQQSRAIHPSTGFYGRP